jgi:hypothetical protein
MAPFVTFDDYIAAGGSEDHDQIRVDFALKAACEQVRRYLGLQVTLVAGDVVTVSGSGTTALLLPELPVVSVNSVTFDGEPVEDWWADESGILRRPGGWVRWRRYVVDYDHGWAEVPADIVSATARLASQLYLSANADGIRQETIGSYSVTYAVTEDMIGPLSVLDGLRSKRVPVP